MIEQAATAMHERQELDRLRVQLPGSGLLVAQLDGPRPGLQRLLHDIPERAGRGQARVGDDDQPKSFHGPTALRSARRIAALARL